MRKWLTFQLGDETLAGVLDGIEGEQGLLIVSGGNETMSGAHGGMAAMAERIADMGHPVFRYDRRGVGDSSGVNGGYETSGDDIAAAAGAFRTAIPGLKSLVVFGNCDAATAIALFHSRADACALVLANPWLIESQGQLPPPAAIRARYREKIFDPREWGRMFRGDIDIAKLLKGLRASRAKPLPSAIATSFVDALERANIPVDIVLAKGDATARVFLDQWRSRHFNPLRDRVLLHKFKTNSHSFAPLKHAMDLQHVIIDALYSTARPGRFTSRY